MYVCLFLLVGLTLYIHKHCTRSEGKCTSEPKLCVRLDPERIPIGHSMLMTETILQSRSILKEEDIKRAKKYTNGSVVVTLMGILWSLVGLGIFWTGLTLGLDIT